MGCFSFHETKNIMSGEGGLFVSNSSEIGERAEIIREKGTNRSKFFRGQVDKYTWVDIGSSYLPSDIISAYLFSVLERSEIIQKKRTSIWNKYYNSLESLENKNLIRRPYIPEYATNNAHMFYIIVDSLDTRTQLISHLKTNNIIAPFHYVPLHSAPAGQKYCKTGSEMNNTQSVSDTLIRLPLFYDLKDNEVQKVINIIINFFK